MMRTLVLADLHLTRSTPSRVTNDLAQLVASHPGSRIIFAGDLLDLSAEAPPHGTRPPSAEEALASHPAVRTALGRHLDGGGELWLAGGNHDAEVGRSGFSALLGAALGISSEAHARINTSPWFFRHGGLHVEHGHLYDPDNAPAHPLVAGESCLGVHFVEEFIAPTGAHAYLNANDGTPLKMFLSSFRLYGVRAPYLIYRFFHTACTALLKSGPLYRADREWDVGSEKVPAFAAASGVSSEVIDDVLGLRAAPTLKSFESTFARLYLDRVASSLALLAGAGAFVAGKSSLGSASLALGVIGLTASWARGHNRYGGNVLERLERSAAHVADAANAKLVVFGHTHAEALEGPYANTGSFSFPRGAPGRPFLEIEGSLAAPRAVRRYLVAPSSR
jgi:predicted phosphodiesterase